MNKPNTFRLAATVCLLAIAPLATATEGGGGSYQNGIENYMGGALPPPGLYFLGYAASTSADTLRDGAGNRVPISFHADASIVAPRVVWVGEQRLLGGNPVLHGIFPVVDLSVEVNGQRQRKSGLGDVTLGAGVSYHASQAFHYVVALNLNAPTGRFEKTDIANIGRNYWTAQPMFAASYVQAVGVNADVKVMYDVNRRNSETNYRSGRELHMDYALGWGVANGWVLGVGGYLYRQVSDDDLPGGTVAGRGKAAAWGPSIKYDNGKGMFITAKWQQEYSVASRAEGTAFMIKATLPF